MKKILSFSLYGDNKKYTAGAIKNAELHKSFFKDWVMRIYLNNSVGEETIQELKNLGVDVILLEEETDYRASLWRFRPMDEEDVSYFISRDIDSRISERDETAVNQWIESGKKFHIIREHPIGHGWVMNAGMWGCMPDKTIEFNSKFTEYLKSYNPPYLRELDQLFLKDVIYPIAKNDVYVNDEFYNYEGVGVKINRSRKLDNFAFIGEPFDENEEFFQHYREDIKGRVSD